MRIALFFLLTVAFVALAAGCDDHAVPRSGKGGANAGGQAPRMDPGGVPQMPQPGGGGPPPPPGGGGMPPPRP